MKLSFVFEGTRRVTPDSFEWFVLPEFVCEGVKFDTVSLPSNVVPLFPLLQPKDKSEVLFQSASEDPGTQCLDLVFSVDKTDDFEGTMARLVPEIKGYVDALDILEKGYHIVERALKQTDARGTIILLRIYRDADFECVEHPEMFLGAPMGQYHCPVCSEMLMAGMPHFTREEIEQPYVQD